MFICLTLAVYGVVFDFIGFTPDGNTTTVNSVCNFVVHDRCLKTVVSPCSTIAINVIKVSYIHFLICIDS